MTALEDEFSEPELRVWEAFPSGTSVDLRTGDPTHDDPRSGDRWDEKRTIRGHVLRALLLGQGPREAGEVPVLRLAGARIVGRVDLAHGSVACPVYLEGCFFAETPDLRWSTVEYLAMDGSHAPGMAMEHVSVTGDLVLASCRVTGPITLRGGTVGGDLVLRDSHLHTPAGKALHADATVISGEVSLDNTVVDGSVAMPGARVGRVLHLAGCHLTNPNGTALDMSLATVDGPVSARGAVIDGAFVMRRAHVAGFVDLADTHLSNPGGDALAAGGLTVEADMRCRGDFRTQGRVILADARITGQLNFSGAHLENPTDVALNATGMNVDGSVYGFGLTTDGTVILERARISGSLRLGEARLRNEHGLALSASTLSVGALSFRKGATLTGGVSLDDASVKYDLDLSEAVIDGGAEPRLTCASLDAQELRLPSAPLDTPIDLRHAHLLALHATPDAIGGGILVEDLTYDALVPLLPAAVRLRMITRHQTAYTPQSYEQLAAAYRRVGNDADARTVLLAKQRRRHQFSPLPTRLWGILQDATIGYGYRPSRAALWLVVLITAGTIAFGHHHPTATTPDGPRFNPFVYTVDLLLPVFSYGQRGAFQPEGAYQWLAYILMTTGWLLATTVLAAVTRNLNRN